MSIEAEADRQPQGPGRQNKRQHFVPQLHLKHFVGDNPKGQVWTYDALEGTARSAAPKNTALQGYFYSIESEDGTINNMVDDFIMENEGHAAPVYEALLRSEFPEKGSRLHDEFAVFLAVMHLRTPTMRRMSAEIFGRGLQILSYASAQHPQSFADIVSEIEKDEGKPLDEETKKRLQQMLIDPSKMVVGVPKERTLSVLAAVKDLATVFLNMKWSLLTAAHGFFVTSDNPVVREVDPNTISPFYGDGGFYNKTAEIIFPLSPKMLLFLSRNPRAYSVKECSHDYTDRVNKALAAHSDRYLYSHIHHKRLEQLAAEFKHTRPGITTQGFGPKRFGTVRVIHRPKRQSPE